VVGCGDPLEGYNYTELRGNDCPTTGLTQRLTTDPAMSRRWAPAPTVDLFGLAFKSRVDCDTLGRLRRLVGGRKRGVRLACTTMGLPYPPTLVDITELWNVLPATYCGRRYRRYRNEGRGYYQYEYRRYGQLDQAAAVTSPSP